MALAFGDFVFDRERRELRRGGTLVKIDPQQLDLLDCLLSHPGVLVSRDELIERVWDGRAIAESALSVAVAKLRKALGRGADSKDYIENRYGRGYRLCVSVNEVASEIPHNEPRSQPTAAGAPLVGRAEYLSTLQTALAHATHGTGRLITLLGEPGIGKTRLAEATVQAARKVGMRTAWGQFTATEGTPPLWPMLPILRELNIDGMADEALRNLQTRLSASNAQAAVSASDDKALQASLDQANYALHHTIDTISWTLQRLGQRCPILIVLDDVQWADSATVRLLNYVASELPRWPVVVLVTARSAEVSGNTQHNRELLRLFAQRTCERIELSRLGPHHVADYVAAVFEERRAELAQTLFARSRGNPFFMVELLRPFVGRGAPEPGELHFSGLVLDVVRERIEHLPSATRTLLGQAAVIGQDFDLGLLRQVGDLPNEAVLEAIDPAIVSEILVASTRLPGGYAFEHELVRDVLYAELAVTERCKLHQRVVTVLSKRREAGLEVAEAELAQHALSALPHGDVAAAVAHARSAALTAMRIAANADARVLLLRSLEGLKLSAEPDPYSLTALLLSLATVERLLGEPDYVEHLQRCVALAKKHRFGQLLTAAGRVLSPSPGLMGQPEAASVLEAAAEMLPLEDTTRRAIVLSHLAWSPPHCHSATRVRELLTEASALAEQSQDPDALATVRDARLFFEAGPEQVREAQLLADEIDHQLREHPETATSARSISTARFRVIAALQHGDAASLSRAIEQRSKVLAKVNNRELSWHHERLLLILRMNRGQFAGAGAEIERLRSIAERLGLHAWPTLWASDLAELLLRTADTSMLAARMRPALTPVQHDLPSVLARKLRFLVELGFEADARAAMVHVTSEYILELPHDRDYIGMLCQLAAASAALAERKQCQSLYALLSPYAHCYAADMSYHCAGSVHHFLGLLSRALREPQAALDHFSQAVASNQRFGLEACRVSSQYQLALCLADGLESAERAQGQALLVQTHRQAHELGLSPLVRSIEQRAT
ncbi:MAG TPA: AAA family ATPase [Polyangiales bacterium]|nr:AAA family ATPase [Polyangiales bacterium]